MSHSWEAARRAAVEVGDAVAEMRTELARLIVEERLAAQSTADRFAHERLNELLSVAYPGIAVISEEDAEHSASRPDSYWLIDPIDGTASWSSGHAGFVCQLAFIVDEQVIFGAIHAPVLGRTWTVTAGLGAYLNGAALPELSQQEIAAHELRVVDNYPQPRGICAEVMQYLGTSNYLESGSIGLKAALVASGEADLFVKDVIVRDWDIAPAFALIAEVGGFVSLPTGQPYEFSGTYQKPAGVIFAREHRLGAEVSAWMTRDH